MVHNETISERTQYIKSLALDEGFTAVGFARAKYLDKEAKALESWLNANYHGKMGYMERYFDMRVDPRLLVDNAKTVISFLFNYYTEKEYSESYKVARYAQGKDYHKILKKKLRRIFSAYQEKYGVRNARIFVDSGPVLERDWALRAGLGWIGKNTLLIHPKLGSYYFLAEIIIDETFTYDVPMRDYCGTCTKCIDACPTDAIAEEGYVLDATKCISYLTIELKDEIDVQFKDDMQQWIFGCDICQEVCPWNRFSRPTPEPDFLQRDTIQHIERGELLEWTEDIFSELVINSPLRRTGLEKIKSTTQFVRSANDPV